MRGNLSNIEDALFMFNSFSESLYYISFGNTILSNAGLILNIILCVLLFRVQHFQWKVLIQILCAGNGLGAACANGLLTFSNFKESTDGYFTEFYLFSRILHNSCKTFIYISEVQGIFHLISLLLASILGINALCSIYHVRYRFHITGIKFVLLAGFSFLMICFIKCHKFSSLRMKTTYYDFNSVKCILCQSRYDSPIVMTKYVISHYHVLIDLLLPMSLWVLIVLSVIMISNKLSWKEAVAISGRKENCYYSQSLILLVLIICAICELPSLLMQGLRVLGNNQTFPSDIYPDRTLSVFVDYRTNVQYSFSTSISGKPFLEDYGKYVFLFFITEITQNVMLFTSYMSSFVFYRLIY